MLFDISNEMLFKDYYNLDSKRIDVLDAKEGLTLGNLFYQSYDQYKNYKPKEIVPKNEREAKLLKIRELSFAINDLNLYLDLYPNDKSSFTLFQKYTEMLKKCKEDYAKEYGPLELCDVLDKYNWINNPWPWDGANV